MKPPCLTEKLRNSNSAAADSATHSTSYRKARDIADFVAESLPHPAGGLALYFARRWRVLFPTHPSTHRVRSIDT